MGSASPGQSAFATGPGNDEPHLCVAVCDESDEEDEAFDSFGQRIRASQTVPFIPTVSGTLQSRPSQTVPASSPVTSVSSPSPNTSTINCINRIKAFSQYWQRRQKVNVFWHKTGKKEIVTGRNGQHMGAEL